MNSTIKNKKNPRSQAGYTASTVIAVLLLATFAFKIAYAVAPAYYDNYLVQSALKDLAEQQGDALKTIRKSEAGSHLSRFYSLNNVRSPVILEALEVDRLKERSIVKVDYEVRTNFMGNADIVLVFKNHLDSSIPNECCTPSEKY